MPPDSDILDTDLATHAPFFQMQSDLSRDGKCLLMPNRGVAQHLLNDNAIPESAMKKLSFSQFIKRTYLHLRSTPVFPFSGRPLRQNLFLANVRCPSGQLQIVAIQLPLVQMAHRLIS